MERAKPRFFYGYLVLFACFLCQVVSSGFVMYSFSIYVKPITDEFGWSRANLMAASTTMNLVMGFTAPLVGRIINRIGAKLMIALGALVTGIGFGLLSLTYSTWQFYVFYAFIGLGSAAMGIVPTSMVVFNWFKRRRGLAIGLLGAGIGVGGFSMPLLTSVILIPDFGWRNAYLITGLIAALVMIPVSLFIIKGRPEDMGLLPDGDSKVGEEVHKNAALETPRPIALQSGNLIVTVVERNTTEKSFTFSQAVRTHAFWLMFMAFFTFGFANQATFQNHAPHLQDIGFSAAIAASAISVAGIGSAIGKFGLGWLCDFVASRYALVLGIIFQATSILILMSIKPDSPVFLIWLYAILLGLGVGSWLPAMSMTTSTTFGLVSYGTIFGVINLSSMLGGAAGPLVAGLIFDTNKNYFWSFITSFCFYAVSLPSIALVRRPKAGNTGSR